MRTIGRLLGSLFVVALVVSLFSMAVNADRTLVTSGHTGWYDYELYSDGELKVIMHSDANSCITDLYYVGKANLATVNRITVDVTATDKIFFSLEGGGCEAASVSVISTDGCKEFGRFEFADLSKIDQADIFFPEGSTVETLYFSWMSFNTLYPDFIENNYKVESWGVSHCESLEEIILPDQEGFTFSVSDCANLKSLIVPESITAFKQSTFWGNDKTITDVYYGGSKSQFNNIKTLVWDDETNEYIISDVPFKSYFGKATIHYFYGKSDWVQDDDGTWSYVDDSGELLTGWNKLDGVWYYFDEDGSMQKNWQKIDEKWYYFGSNGAMRTGWQKIDSNWYYLGTDGAMSTKWRSVDGKWYYFGDSGVMRTGWWQLDGSWYYLKASGEMATGWVSSGGYWYYMNNNGVMLKNWQQIDGTWYYLGNSGAMLTGWQKVSGKYYYFASSGAMQTGWLKLGNTWYYLEGSGEMVTGKKTIDGIEYTFDDETGVWVA